MSKKLYSERIKEAHLQSSGLFEKVWGFEEKPSTARFDGDGHVGKYENLKAHELFSIFTADIIKHEVIFTR